MSPVTQFNNAPQDPAMKKKNYGPLVLLVTLAFAVVTFYGTVRSTDSVDTALTAKDPVRTPGPESSVCGEKRFAPNGNVPIDTITQLHGKNPQWGLVSDKDKGPNSKEYDSYCGDKSYIIKGEGEGGMSDYALGLCTDPKGCEIFRSFDIPIELELNRRVLRAHNTKINGGFWTLEEDLSDDSGKGKTLSQYAYDEGVCEWGYTGEVVDHKIGGEGGIGGAGGFMGKCTIPVGHHFAFGPGQSVGCIDENGNDSTIPKSDVIQIYIDLYAMQIMTDCIFCAVKDYDPLSREAPDITKCDGEWKDIDNIYNM